MECNRGQFEDEIGNAGFLTAIVDGSDDDVIAFSLSGAILTWNRSAETIFGYSTGEAIGTQVSLLAAPESAPGVQQDMERILAGTAVSAW